MAGRTVQYNVLTTPEKLQQVNPDNVIQMIIGWSSLDMVGLYKDIEVDEEFEKYFGEDGIKKVEQASLADL